jgi:hypothetical protein
MICELSLKLKKYLTLRIYILILIYRIDKQFKVDLIFGIFCKKNYCSLYSNFNGSKALKSSVCVRLCVFLNE